jgi:hypothetical protein
MARPEIVGALGTSRRATVDPTGSVAIPEGHLDWWIGADDGWHFPSEDTTTRHRRPNAAPIFETAVHIPGGDVVHRAYAVTAAGSGAVTVIDIENTTRLPCSIALVLRIRDTRTRVAVDGNTVMLHGRSSSTLSLSRAPRLWADGSGDEVRTVVTTGQARSDETPSWRAPHDIALLVPGPPRTTFRVLHASAALDPMQVTTAEAVERGWQVQLERGMRTELPEPWQARIDEARADLLLAPPSAAVVSALEDWGFDAEAATMWHRLSMRARRVARRREALAHPWDALRDGDSEAALVLRAMRQVLVDERTHSRDAEVDLLPFFPSEWLGQHLAVHDVPTRQGLLSFALRWHGARPALLWDAPAGVTVRVPALDGSWSATAAVGETLLAEPPPTLLPMGTQERTAGDAVDAPESFS